MLTRQLRSILWAVFAVLLVAGSEAALAQEVPGADGPPGAAPAPRSLPDGADEAAMDQRIVLPDLPAITVDLGDRRDATGSLPSVALGANGVEAPPPLPFDDRSISVESAPAAPAPAAAIDTIPPAAAAPVEAPVADSPAAPVLPATTAVASGGLDAVDLTAAIARFVDDTPVEASAALTSERRGQRAAVVAFYAAHADAPLWIADGRLTPGARSALARLDHAAEDGLDLSRYAVPVPRDAETATLAAAELAISEAVVAYARQASGSRVDVARLGGIIDMRPTIPEAAQVLGTVAAAPDAGEALRATNPPNPGYIALREKLAELRQSRPGDLQSRIPPGPVLKPGMSDARVPLIRARFGLDVAADDPGVPTLVYDTRVAAAVAAFQRTHGLPASGLLTQRTIAALSGGNPTTLENDIIANMELWRWMPRDLGPDRVEVNIPDYTAHVVRDGALVHETRVVVGQPDKPTPVFAQQMKFIIVNPYWNVPLSIIKKEMMPKLASDPNYFADHGYEVVERDGVRYVRQPPGDGNALGRIKFMFPNVHSVYLHDTNARSYFARDMRALSHGCVRVEQPFSFAEAVMGRDNGWPEARIKRLIGGQERTISLPKPLPIFITYFTAFVDPQAGFQLRDDVYGYAGKVKAALGLQG